ncbi:hypothetical protein B0H13DRAFT_2543857 [Mycena leptocephala]|nr:hypothetical protein B0H13DRAFT_2543857 [Mycena leptocephala]
MPRQCATCRLPQQAAAAAVAMCVPTPAIAVEKSCSAICSTDRCTCYLAHHECDPELCLKCQAKVLQGVYDLTTEPIAEHRGRNYLFELNNMLSINSMYVGNNTRYINQDTQNPNCCARVCMVKSEHWIGIYAT